MRLRLALTTLLCLSEQKTITSAFRRSATRLISKAMSTAISSPCGSEAKKAPRKAKAAAREDSDDEEEAEEKVVKKQKKAKVAVPDGPFPRDPTPAKPRSSGSGPYLSMGVYNVAGLRAMAANETSMANLRKWVTEKDLDIVCLQEHKLQRSMASGFTDILPGYKSFWVFSEEPNPKGYSGVCLFLRSSTIAIPADVAFHRADFGVPSSTSTSPSSGSASSAGAMAAFLGKSAPSSSSSSSSSSSASSSSSSSSSASSPSSVATLRSVTYDISPAPRISKCGRAITLEFDSLYVVGCYVPNAGQGLKNIDFRLKEWDPTLRQYLADLRSTGKAVVLMGDLNVAHRDIDVYNAGAPHLKKQPGCTAEERASFDELLGSGFRDAFRQLWPSSTGQFSYFSGRVVTSRVENKGLRLDYFLCSENMFGGGGSEGGPRVHDTQVDYESSTREMSDHAPVSITLRL